MISPSLTRKILFSLFLTFAVASYANGQTPWAEKIPPAGSSHSLPTRLFPPDNWWNLNISQAPVDPNSAFYVANVPSNTKPWYDWGNVYGIPYVTVSGNYPKVFFQGGTYWDESDHIGYPIPTQALSEPGWTEDLNGTIDNPTPNIDRHLLIVDVDNQILYEIYQPFHNASSSPVQWSGVTVQPGAYYCAGAVSWDMKTNNTRQLGWTSTDAAGLQVLPGLVQYDEIMGTAPITHAHRFTLNFSANTQPFYVWPATHYAPGSASSSGHPPLGTRFRLKASKDISYAGPHAQKLLQSMKDYGIIFADNGTNGQITGTNDQRWGSLNSPIRTEIALALDPLTFNDFEVVQLAWQPSASPTPTPSPTPPPTGSIQINFQPASAAVPSGYMADTGAVYGDRGNGYNYGWDQATPAVDRNSANSPDQRYDTLNDWWASTWEIAVPNGTYTVHVVAGDPDYYDSVFKINVEGVLTVNGTPTTTTRWIEGTQTVTVNDGKLTLSQAAGSYNNKICFVDISPPRVRGAACS